MDEYHYDPLDVSRREIRLLDLCHASDDQEDGTKSIIRCAIFSVSLDEAPSYEALSYAWGSTARVAKIVVNGKECLVPGNVSIALEWLRRRKVCTNKGSSQSHRRLWIDALCIDQENIPERNIQVAMMWSIYARASRVLVWLGDACDESDLAMILVSVLDSGTKPGSTITPPGILFGVERCINPFSSLQKLHDSTEGEQIYPHKPNEWIAFQKLMKRPWWRRVWIVQEIAAARRESGTIWVGCGTIWLPWWMFERAAKLIREYLSCPSYFQQLGHLDMALFRIECLTDLRSRAHRNLDDITGFIYLLTQTRDHLASDPRDKIFALLGFVPSIGLLPDYTRKAEEVYEEVTRTVIGSSRILGMLLLNRFPKSLDLPTWVPDFSRSQWSSSSGSVSQETYNASHPTGFFGADGNQWANIRGCALDPKDTAGKLSLTGFTFDTPLVIDVEWSGEPEEQQSMFFHTVRRYQRRLAEFDGKYCRDRVEQHERDEAFWRTLIWNSDASGRYPAPDIFGDLFSTLTTSRHFLLPSRKVGSDVTNLVTKMVQLVHTELPVEDLPIPNVSYQRAPQCSITEQHFFTDTAGVFSLHRKDILAPVQQTCRWAILSASCSVPNFQSACESVTLTVATILWVLPMFMKLCTEKHWLHWRWSH